MEGADAVPFGGEPGEEGLGGLRPLRPHRGEPGAPGGEPRIGRVEAVEQRAEKGGRRAAVAQAEEGPGALAMALDQAGFGEQLEVARDARLRLAEDVGEIGDRELALREQREDLKPRFLRRGPKGGESLVEAGRGCGGRLRLRRET